MALPKITRPEYSTTVPSTGKKIKYNPFTVREEKVLMLAAEGQESEEIINAVTNCIETCVTSPNDFKVADLALFDIEYLFLKMRSKSVGEMIQLVVTDPNDETFKVEHEINIDKIGVKKTAGHKEVIDITPEVKVKMRYPGIDFFTEGIDVSNVKSSVDVIAKCIHQIITEEEVFERADMTDAEVREWIEDLTQSQFSDLSNFITSMPRLSHSITLRNTNTKKDFTVKLEGLADFF